MDIYSPYIFHCWKIGGEEMFYILSKFLEIIQLDYTSLWGTEPESVENCQQQILNPSTFLHKNAHSPSSFSLCQYNWEYFWVDKCSTKSIHHGERFLQQDNWTSGIPLGVRYLEFKTTSEDFTSSFVIFFFLLNHLPFANFICGNFFESQSL